MRFPPADPSFLKNSTCGVDSGLKAYVNFMYQTGLTVTPLDAGYEPDETDQAHMKEVFGKDSSNP